jgi:ATP-dependent helicase HrpA
LRLIALFDQQFPTPEDLHACLLKDRHEFRRRLRGIEARRDQGKPFDQGLAKLIQAIAESQALLRHRRDSLPRPQFPTELPISRRWEEIAETIRQHQVVVLCGETGSGKSTQLPKICLALGLGVAGRIGHTQPRRIAARSLASRVSQELGTDPGTVVGYKVRFHDRVQPATQVKLMTDGILLAEIQQDRHLNEYDTLIIDEAHERSLNIDFLLGYLKQMLPRRPDLKLIITSATIDPQRFSRHFGAAPVIEVSGRTYPVETRYRPPEDESAGERDEQMQQAIVGAVDELGREGRGDILVFLSGEREIRETAETLRKHHMAATEVLALYARLSPQEQARIFQPHGARRVVLATNVAETSLTVPGIRYVIDAGYARISRYSHRSKVQRLPVERISRASADQRKGRCGRVAEGVCIRLYSEDNLGERREFTEPEILRTNLASVILQMKVLGFGEIEAFPFVEPPDSRLISDGYRLLGELGAVDGKRQVTPLGRQLARLPVDPRIGRMLLAAASDGCLREVLVIASALAVQDPRDRPVEKQQAADEAHAMFQHEDSDFLTFWNLWQFLEEKRSHLSRNQFRKLCQKHFLSWSRVTEWHDTHQQLRGLLHEQGYRESAVSSTLSPGPSPAGGRGEGPSRDPGRRQSIPAGKNAVEPRYPEGKGSGEKGGTPNYDLIHSALLTGLLSHIGVKDEQRQYEGARGARFWVHPGSGQFDASPKWIMAAERVQTTKDYGRIVARIQPQWIERAGAHLLKRSYSEPHWQSKRGQVAAYEKVSLYGLVLVPRRRINYGPINPAEAREVFIRAALVDRDFETRAPFFRHNRELIEYVEHLEAKSRRRDILVDDEAIYAFYQQRVPSGIYCKPDFENWLRKASKSDPKLLHMHISDVMVQDDFHLAQQAFPETLAVGGAQLPLEYHFDPGHRADGITLVVPLALVNQVPAERCEWLVPGLLEELITALLRGLPKQLRKAFVPIPDTARRLLNRIEPSDRPLFQGLGEAIREVTGRHVPEDAWDLSAVPDHLRMRFRIVDDAGQEVAGGRDFAQLRKQHGGKGSQQFAKLPDSGLERDGVTRWDFGELPETVSMERGGIRLQGHPALVDRGDSVSIQVLDSAEAAEQAMRAGQRRLLMLSLPQDTRYLRKNLPGLNAMRLQYAKAPAQKGPTGDIENELVALIIDRTFFTGRPRISDAAAFETRIAENKGDLMMVTSEVCKLAENILDSYQKIRKRLDAITQIQWLPSVQDMRAQLDGLVYKGCLAEVPFEHLKDYPRYLKALETRAERLPSTATRDRQNLQQMARLNEDWRSRSDKTGEAGRQDPRLDEIRWMLEELRISLFAQPQATAYPVSVKRIEKRWKELGL